MLMNYINIAIRLGNYKKVQMKGFIHTPNYTWPSLTIIYGNLTIIVPSVQLYEWDQLDKDFWKKSNVWCMSGLNIFIGCSQKLSPFCLKRFLLNKSTLHLILIM